MNEYLRMILIMVVMLLASTFLTFCRADATTDVVGLSGIEDVEVNPPDPMTSYGYKEVDEWTTWNKVWFGGAVSMFGVGDTASTVDGLNRGCVESNAWTGKDPSTGLLIAGKVIGFIGIWAIIEYGVNPENRVQARNIFYPILTAAGTYVTVRNATTDCI